VRSFDPGFITHFRGVNVEYLGASATSPLAVNLGTAAADCLVVVVLPSTRSAAPGNAPSSITIDAVESSIISNNINAGSGAGVAIAQRLVTAGGSINIAWTLAASVAWAAAYKVTNGNSKVAYDWREALGNEPAIAIDVKAGGGLIASAANNADNAITLSGVTADASSTTNNTNGRRTWGHSAINTDETNKAVSASSSAGDEMIAGISYGRAVEVATGSITHVGSASNGAASTSTTITIPSGTQAGDVLVAAFSNRGASATPTVVDDDSGGNTWELISPPNKAGTLWWKRATSGTASKTITASGFTTACSGGVSVFRGVTTEGNPFATATHRINASGTETHQGFTPPCNNCRICLAVCNTSANSPVSSQSSTDPGALTEHYDQIGGTCATSMATASQTTAGPTGALTWAQSNAGTQSIGFALIPA